jgi:hypothetical protein
VTSRSWIRRYPPLVSLVLALLIAFLVLPSALTLPNANPSPVLEYAPVPPENDEPPPPESGSLSQLGLGTSSSLSTGAGPDVSPPVPLPGGKGAKPITKRCVGKPLRETEDPNSPPCVPYFEGDNGGATFQGVTKDEIVVIDYTTGGPNYFNQNNDEGVEFPPPNGSYCDLDGPPDSDPQCLESTRKTKDFLETRVARALSRYFNDRFQTYGRRVHFYIYYSGSSTPAARRADAADNYATLKPFAVIDRAFFGGNNATYAEAMTKNRVSVYGNFSALPAAYYQKYAPYIWSFWPDIEHWSPMFTSYVCRKVFPNPTVTHAGPSLNGKPRKYGLLYANDPIYPGLKQFADVTKAALKNCPNGAKGDVVEEVSFPRNQFAVQTNPTAAANAEQNIAKLQAAGVTTILWLGGYETEHSKAAANAGYLPEWIVAGDLINDYNDNGRSQNQTAWAHAWVVSNQLRIDRKQDSPCNQAYREVEPRGSNTDEDSSCNAYRAFFQLFKSIQVAGPNLNPQSVDQGQHAIQKASSQSPGTAACFYDPGDYTCVKDAQESWWDPNAPDPDGSSSDRGCWRMVRSGRRYLAGAWDGTDADPFSNPADPCNAVGGPTYVALG